MNRVEGAKVSVNRVEAATVGKGRRAFLVAVLAGGALAAAINAQALALSGLHVYQQTVSPILVRAGLRCRFTPTCSRYAEVVIARDGVLRGGLEAITRIARCGPWTPAGTRDDP